MRQLALTLKDVTRFTEATTIDFRTMPAGLIAVTGPNGSGKTTLIEAGPAAVHRQFPSRDKELVDYVTSRDAFIEAVFLVDTRTLTLRVNLDGEKRKSDAVITEAGVLKPLAEGLKAYDASVATLFPPRELLLASAVAAQNRTGTFITLDRAERKDLFAQLLGLAQYDAMATTAKSAAAMAETARTTLVAQRGLLTRDADPRLGDALRVGDEQAAAERGSVTGRREELQRERTQLTATRTTLTQDAARCQEATARLDALTVRALDLAGQLSRAEAQHGMAGARAEADTRDVANGLALKRQALIDGTERDGAALLATHTRLLEDLDKRIANNRKTLAAEAQIRRTDAERLAAAQELDTLQRDLEALVGIRDAINREHGANAQALSAAQAAVQALARAEADAASITRAPFGDQCGAAKCSFLVRALAAREEIPTLRATADQVAALQATHDELSRRYTTARDEETALQRRIGAVRVREATARTVRIGDTDVPMSKLLASLDSARERIAEYEAAKAGHERDTTATRERLLTRRDEQIAAAEADAETHRTAIAERLAQTRAALDQEIATLRRDVGQVRIDIETTRAERAATQEAAAQLAEVERRLDAASVAWDETTRVLARLDAEDVARRRQRFEWTRASRALASVETRLAAVERHLLEWQFLHRALARDGLPTLEIDAAGPTVSNYWNDLLATCFGPRFSCELITQVARADGKGTKETFDILVFDNLRGGERAIADLSGGEQIIVDEALKSALALFVNSRNVDRIDTLYRDETTGPLDPENARRYVDMLRRAMELGGFYQCLFVTHNADAASLADAQLYVEDGRVEVRRPPYRRGEAA